MNPTAPYAPSAVEAKYFYYGIPSQPRLVARSSADPWVKPEGPEAYLSPKESSPVGLHPLSGKWETTIAPAMVAYLDRMEVQWTSLDPIRMGPAGESSNPVIIWIGVSPNSLTADLGVQVAIGCKSILVDNSIDDVHVEIRESEVTRSAQMYKPVVTSNPIVNAIEPFSTTLGLPICAENTPNIRGTAGFFLTDPSQPDKLYLLTARHVVFDPNNVPNELYHYQNPSQPRRNVLLMGNEAIKRRIEAIGSEIGDKQIIIAQLESRLKAAKELDEEDAMAEREVVQPLLDQANKAIKALEHLHGDIMRDWEKPEQRILGHVVLSPPIALNVGDEGCTEDWALIEVDPSKVNSTNLVGNAVDLGISIPVDTFTAWMYPNPVNPTSFQYPGNRLLKFSGTISDGEMLKPDSRTLDHGIMVLKRGCASDLTVGRLNTIRSFVRLYFKGQPGEMSKEVAVLPRTFKSGAFSKPGDSGSVVLDGKGRVVGLLTGGAGIAEVSDCTYLTSINFLLKRLAMYGIQANIFPTLTA